MLSALNSKQGKSTNRTIEKIVETAAWLFSFQFVSFETFDRYMDDITVSEDRNDCLTREAYASYLEKVSKGGRKLAEKMRE